LSFSLQLLSERLNVDMDQVTEIFISFEPFQNELTARLDEFDKITNLFKIPSLNSLKKQALVQEKESPATTVGPSSFSATTLSQSICGHNILGGFEEEQAAVDDLKLSSDVDEDELTALPSKSFLVGDDGYEPFLDRMDGMFNLQV